MPHGAPDDSNVVKTGRIFRLDDMSELAVRLGSFVTYDRRGDVIFADSFEDGDYRWLLNYINYPAYKVISIDYAKSGAVSCKITTAPYQNSMAGILCVLMYPLATEMGMEFSYLYDSNASYVDGDFVITYNDVTYHYSYRHDVQNKAIYIYTQDGFVKVDDTKLSKWGVEYFVPTKIVANLEAERYERLMLGSREYDLSDYSPYIYPYGEVDKITVSISVQASRNYETILYVDDVVLTVNEPVD